MTIQEFHIAFDIELDKTLDFEYPYISPEQKDYWLNKAQDRFVKSRAFGNNIKLQGFEESEKRIDDLRTIVVKSALIVPTSEVDGYQSQLPSDYLYLERHRCRIVSPINIVTSEDGYQTRQDSIGIELKDPFWTPDIDQPLYYIIGNTIIYETLGRFTITGTWITYIRKYSQMKYGTQYVVPSTDVTSELPIHTHTEILDLAITMVLENIESQRYQTNLNELTKSE